MYDDHLRLIGKRIGEILLALSELFSLGRMAEALRAIIGSKSAFHSNGGRLTKISGRSRHPPPNILLSEN